MTMNFVEIALVLTYYVGNAVYVVFITESITKVSFKIFKACYNNIVVLFIQWLCFTQLLDGKITIEIF
ncbi:hypothetical protein NQ314_012038 [Rhamnusium bicolor]|uniref:Uncharacterized protein n=1 Tax=Rhamnusium bicolor TaxID=1586634 RepID=A0AAV8XE96_9CUCU|nr:hypothetical protein NQ314_012038 [Rhamnusium bicolor]